MSAVNRVQPQDILHFWFEELGDGKRFAKDVAVDETIRARYGATVEQAVRCELEGWRATDDGRLAEIIVLDQFSRNLFREDDRAFRADPMSLALAQEMVRLGADVRIAIDRRAFVYLPYMHSESLVIHEAALKLFATPGLEENFQFELKHLEIIKRFGRYPHRNKLLGRASTPDEVAFLAGPGSSF